MTTPFNNHSAISEMGFTPLDLVDITVGRVTAKVYPKITSTMEIFERAHAWQINKTALVNLPAEFKLIIDAFGAQLNATSTVEGITSDWRRYFADRWYNFNHLTILSFHNSEGTIIDDTTTAANSQILLPVQDGVIANCRQQDIKFVRVQCTVDFISLVTVNPYPVGTILRTTFYIELPQETRVMINGAGGAYTLVSFLGPSDLRMLTPPELKAQILDVCMQDGPVLLQASDFNLATANTNAHAFAIENERKILKIAWHQLCTSIFNEICPEYSSQPQAALEHIKQSYQDSDGNMVCSPAFAYYQRVMNAMRPFAGDERFPVSVCNKLIDGIDQRLVPIFRRNYREYAVIHDLQASYQRSRFPLILSAMKMAEDEVQSIATIARSSVGGQAFSYNANVYPSQAESTITRYSSGYKSDGGSSGYRTDDTNGSRGLGKSDRCFGCKGVHPWMKDGVIVCPNRDQPGVRAVAEANYKAWLEKARERRTNRQSKKRKGGNEYENMTPENKARIKQQVLASMGVATINTGDDTSTITADSSAKPASSKPPMILIADVQVLSSANLNKDILPAPIVSNLPHVLLQFGTSLDDPDCPSVRCLVDTGAALTTGNFHYVAAIAKRYPHCVAKIYGPEDYNAIVLSGIIQRGAGESVATELTVGFQFHLPYLTREGQATSILIATGPHVAVNAIVGLPFIQATRMIIDASDHVVDMRALDTPPFPLEYRRAAVHVPILEESGAARTNLSDAHTAMIKDIEDLELFFSNAAVEQYGAGRVSFGSRAVSQPLSPSKSALRVDTVLGKHGLTESSVNDYSDPTWGIQPDIEHRCLAQSPSIEMVPSKSPIRVTPRPKSRQKLRNVFYDDRGFPDQTDDFDHLLHNIDGGVILRKTKFPAPALDTHDPLFDYEFSDDIHGPILAKDLDLSHLSPENAASLRALIKKYWMVFDERGTFTPVKNYQCVIDTGNSAPIAVKKINYGTRETPIMRKSIAALEKVGHIRQIHDGQWLFKATLAPKPHQETVTSIDDFVWRFCVNYIRLNQVTKLIVYPIPRCDMAVEMAFGSSMWHWMYDAPMGYHQLSVAPESQEKLAFQGTDAIKWTYVVMPFGPVNGPATFIAMIHDLDSVWKALAKSIGLSIDDDTNTNIIVDDIFNWAKTFANALKYIECQLRVCKAYRLTLSLKKSHFFRKRFEFVGIDVSIDGNRPAMSKHELLRHWPSPELVRDVASFVGFLQFYSKFIPFFEVRALPLRVIMEREYSEAVGESWTDEAQTTFDELKQSILCDPCLRRFDYRKLTVLRTDFSARGFGYVVCQPANDDISTAMAAQFMSGNGFDFMGKEERGILHPVAFGSRRTRGNEKRLHSYLGEGFAGDWAMNKVRHMCFGRRFVWVTDCYAVKFILTYDGSNPAVLRLQMRLMGWDVEIVHRSAGFLTDADYWSRLDADLCYDPSFRTYLHMSASLRSNHPAPETLPMLPEHMPYYRGPRIVAAQDYALPHPASSDTTAAFSMADITLSDPTTPFSNHPIRFGEFQSAINNAMETDGRQLYNSEYPVFAFRASRFTWAVYSFNSGHFASTIAKRNLPFSITLACDPFAYGRALFKEFTQCPIILPSATALLDHIRGSGNQSLIDGYLIHSHRYQSSEPTTTFWTIQTSIIVQLQSIRKLSLFVAFVHPDHDGRSVAKFVSQLSTAGWTISSTQCSFPDYGDSVAGTTTIIVGVHTNTQSKVTKLQFRTPPSPKPIPLAAFLWPPFNKKEFSISLSKDDESFHDGSPPALTITLPSTSILASMPRGVTPLYFLHSVGADSTILNGAAILSPDSLCLAFDGSSTTNLFKCHFGVEFHDDGHTYVRVISPFEFTSCFGLVDNLRYRLSQHGNWFALDAGIPSSTSSWVFDHILERLVSIRDSNMEIHQPNQYNAPAATIQAFLSGAVSTQLPTRNRWIKAYGDDSELSRIRNIILNPATLSNASLRDINYNYHSALRNSLIILEDDMMIYREPISGSGGSYTRLQLVPKEFYNILFVAFHSNPLGGHLNAYRTLHRLRLRFYWPGMYSYIKRMCQACPGCALANPSKSKSSELVYNFPIEAPFLVLHVDAYSAGAHTGFEGSSVYLVACCGMCTFGALEPISGANATSFASAIMKIQLRFGFCHTIVLDKDSKFFGVFRESLDLLKINIHVISGDNHNAMIVERLCRYFNKGLRIMTNERGSIRVALESLLLLLYAWNSCPVPGTDISRSLVAVGREFAFPIDFSSSKHWELTSSPATVESYSKDLAERLGACRDIAMLLVGEQRAWHRELVNSRRRDPRIYSPGDIVFARRATRSDAARGRVGKLEFAFTGPWRILEALHGGSYSIEHCHNEKRRDKKHAADLTPYPQELIPFAPVDGADTRYGQLHKPIGEHPFKEAGIKGFEPSSPFRVPASYLDVGIDNFHWPTLAELNDELDPFPWRDEEERRLILSDENSICPPVMYTGPPPSPPPMPRHENVPPSITTLSPLIISSSNKLFFISSKIGTADCREWRLVRVAFDDSVALYPSCLQDGRFLVDFYMSHPADIRYNAINQRFWLQYRNRTTATFGTMDAHLITPSDTSEARAARLHLIPLRAWVNLTHGDTYIHGPFDFAIVNGRKSRDRVGQEAWDVLASRQSMFSNPLPRFDLPTYSIHVDRGVHTVYPDLIPTPSEDELSQSLHP